MAFKFHHTPVLFNNPKHDRKHLKKIEGGEDFIKEKSGDRRERDIDSVFSKDLSGERKRR